VNKTSRHVYADLSGPRHFAPARFDDLSAIAIAVAAIATSCLAAVVVAEPPAGGFSWNWLLSVLFA
jgi:hypothetical protein